MEITGYNLIEKTTQQSRTNEIDKSRESKERDDQKRADEKVERVTISEEAREKAVQNKENAR